jgi:hypothetical protein
MEIEDLVKKIAKFILVQEMKDKIYEQNLELRLFAYQKTGLPIGLVWVFNNGSKRNIISKGLSDGDIEKSHQ